MAETVRVAFAEVPTLIGRTLGPSSPLTVDQARIDAFAEATGDRQWIHTDVARAEAEIGGTIAHGYLTLSLLPALADGLVTIDGLGRRVNAGLDRVRFLAPVPGGATLAVEQTVSEVEPRGEAWRVVWESRFLRGDGVLAGVARTVTLLYPAAP